jgi:uncharacterized protein YukE
MPMSRSIDLPLGQISAMATAVSPKMKTYSQPSSRTKKPNARWHGDSSKRHQADQAQCGEAGQQASSQKEACQHSATGREPGVYGARPHPRAVEPAGHAIEARHVLVRTVGGRCEGERDPEEEEGEVIFGHPPTGVRCGDQKTRRNRVWGRPQQLVSCLPLRARSSVG